MIRKTGLLSATALMAFGQPKVMFSPVRGTHEMVGAANNFQVEAGFRMLAAGGNAVDAGVASVLAAAVTEQSRFGLGGEMPLLIKMSGKPPVAISGVGTAPKLATPDYYRNRKPEPWEERGPLSPVPVKGFAQPYSPACSTGSSSH